MRFDGGDNRLECGQFFVRSAPWRIAVVAQAIAAMEPVGALVRAIQRFFRTHEHGNIRAAEFCRVEGIACGLLDGNISGDRGNRQDAHLERTERHDQSYGVIGSRIGINQEERFHAA